MYGSDHLPPPDDSAAEALLRRIGVAGPFLLSVATLEPRKNLPRLIDAYQQARADLPASTQLLVVGPTGWGPELSPGDGVVLGGAVDDAVLAALYARARAVVYVPLHEGFGLPPLEAMRAGAVVVASPVPSIDGTDAALVVDPLDADAIAGGLVQVAGDDRMRARLAAAGAAHVAGLTWTAAANRHADLWERVARGEV
jgi:glycosyltransferase involved in cell wall biosynthesis